MASRYKLQGLIMDKNISFKRIFYTHFIAIFILIINSIFFTDNYISSFVQITLAIVILIHNFDDLNLVKMVKYQYDYLNKILNSQVNFTVITNGKILKQTNKTTLDFFGYKTLEDFQKDSSCICNFFIKEDAYLYKEQNGKSWLDIILDDNQKKYFVKMKDLKQNIHTFQINIDIQQIIGEKLYVVTFTDITELEEKQKYISSILEASDEGQIIIDQNSIILDFNNRASQIFTTIKKDISLGKFFVEEEEEEEVKLCYFINDVSLSPDYNHIFSHSGKHYNVKHKLLNKYKRIILFQDITELLNLQNTLEQRIQNEVDKNREKDMQLFETAKMASMGEMIGNIAHQWRQPLNAITATTADLELHSILGTLNDKAITDITDTINQRVQYLSNTINTFRNFIKEKKEKKDIIIQDRIKTVINIVGTSLKDNYIELIEDIDYTQSTKINTIVGELDQVIINILNNAKDVLKDKKPQNPWIKLSLIIQDEHIITTIEDNGGGIPVDIIDKIFDPYFTTKHKSQGTGLGLHMSQKIIHDSLTGTLTVINTSKGALFTIMLPKYIL
jgi:signal transduction histidine kinase